VTQRGQTQCRVAALARVTTAVAMCQ